MSKTFPDSKELKLINNKRQKYHICKLYTQHGVEAATSVVFDQVVQGIYLQTENGDKRFLPDSNDLSLTCRTKLCFCTIVHQMKILQFS